MVCPSEQRLSAIRSFERGGIHTANGPSETARGAGARNAIPGTVSPGHVQPMRSPREPDNPEIARPSTTQGPGPASALASPHASRVGVPSGAENVALQLGDCAVYRVTRSFFKTKIEKSLSMEFYLGPTICTSQSLTVEGAFAVASLCRQAFGAGGGCARGGTYRTSDAIHWEKRGNASAWIAVPADE